jgi:hypothetical protein
MSSFEPFFNYEKLTPKMAKDLRDAVVRHRLATDSLIRSPVNIKQSVAAIEAAYDVESVIDTIRSAIWTVPVMVHLAGEKQFETCEHCEYAEQVIQRCKRCGSTLHLWHEHLGVLTPDGPRELGPDDVPWWDENEIVAKAHFGSAMTMYSIDPSRLLEKHEMECVSLVDLEGPQ